MDLIFTRDESSGRLICTCQNGDETRVVTAANATVACAELLLAVDDVRDTGFGECFWPEGGGEYRWMLRRAGDRLTVVALWSTGTLTGWEHVLRAETDFDTFDAETRERLSNMP
jgi:hypothetical protein